MRESTMRKSNISRVAAFTLVELLVVLVIISLLVTLAVPPMTKAMALAKLSKCKENLKSQIQAHALYGSNNRFNKPPIVWRTRNSFGYFLVSPNSKVSNQPVGQGILVKEDYLPLRAILCPASSMLDDSAADEDAWIKRSLSGSSYSYFWRHSSSFPTGTDPLGEYKYSNSEAAGRYGLAMDFNAMSGHTYIGVFGTSDWASHPILGRVNIAYSDGSVNSIENWKVVLRSPFNTRAKMDWWEEAHKARH